MKSDLQILDLSSAAITEIPAQAFAQFRSLKEVVLPEGLTTIREAAFANCTALEKVNIPATVRTLSTYSFYACKSLSSINIPDGVTELSNSIFAESGLKSVTIPGSVRTIGDAAFKICSKLKEVEIKDGVISIGSEAFHGCDNLEMVELPYYSITSIGDEAFSNCISLRKFVIPIGVTEIKDYTFSRCEELKHIHWHDNITSIGAGAFFQCRSLLVPMDDTSLRFPANLQNIGLNAFFDCNDLESVDMTMTKVKKIADGSFCGCDRLTFIGLPKELETIGNSAFEESPLEFVVCPAVTAPKLGSNVFSGAKENCKLSIPAGAKISYDTEGWTTLFKVVEEMDMSGI